MLLAQLTNDAGIGRVDVINDLFAQTQGRPDRDRVSERMEEGQDAQ